MDRPERDLVAALRSELAAIEPTRRCCRSAERAGLGDAAMGRARTPAVARLAVRLSHDGAAPAFEWEAAADHCRLAYLRGVFLSRGSLSLAGGRSHLEFVVDPGQADRLDAQLRSVGFPAARRMRRGRGVLIWKSGERLTGFLRAIGGGPALLELEARAVTRSLQGDLNRVVNAEAANLDRAVAAAARQIAAIELLEGDGRLAEQGEALQALARARRDAPEATLAELAGDLGISRSAAQRGLGRFERLASRAVGQDGRNRGSPSRHSARDEAAAPRR